MKQNKSPQQLNAGNELPSAALLAGNLQKQLEDIVVRFEKSQILDRQKSKIHTQKYKELEDILETNP